MLLRILPLFLVFSSLVSFAQTTFRVTEVRITEKEQTTNGTDVTVNLRNDEGSKGVVIYAAQDLEVKGHFKVKSHNVARSSMKNSAVYLTMVLKLKSDGKTDQREVQKVFYMEDKRDATFTEKFVIKRGINTRVITVTFKGELL
jgi:hypothetical protein